MSTLISNSKHIDNMFDVTENVILEKVTEQDEVVMLRQTVIEADIKPDVNTLVVDNVNSLSTIADDTKQSSEQNDCEHKAHGKDGREIHLFSASDVVSQMSQRNRRRPHKPGLNLPTVAFLLKIGLQHRASSFKDIMINAVMIPQQVD